MQGLPKQEHQSPYESTMTRIERSIILIDDGSIVLEEAEACLRHSLAWFALRKEASEGQRAVQPGPHSSIEKSG
jgi:hypothetical protein